jgi:hypothetical protein
MRRLPLAWLLSLLLVFAQHGAVLHELSHMGQSGRGSAPALRADVQLPDSACSTCAAFAVVANPASGTANTFAACAPVFLAVPGPSGAFVGADAPTPRNRGPPQA